MTQSAISSKEPAKEAKLPLRDWILLPLLGLFTICFLLVSSEWIAGRTFTSTGNVALYCYTDDPVNGYRGIPNSVCTDKNPDTPLIEYRFNNCGHRTVIQCGPKPPGTYRIVMLGSSTAMGWTVPQERAFAALLPPKLSARTGRKVEVYNESPPGGKKGTPHNIALRFDDVLAAEPDMVLWIVTPLDIENAEFEEAAPRNVPKPAGNATYLSRVRNRIVETVARGSIADELLDVWNSHSISSMTQHYMYESQSLYMRSFLQKNADYLKSKPSVKWQGRLRLFDTIAAGIESRASAAGVPVVVVLLSGRAHATILSTGDWPTGYDPYRLDNDLRSIITSHGGTYLDILPDFREIPDPGQYFWPLDGHHPNVEGHRIIAELLVKEFTSGAIPALKAVAEPQSALVRKR